MLSSQPNLKLMVLINLNEMQPVMSYKMRVGSANLSLNMGEEIFLLEFLGIDKEALTRISDKQGNNESMLTYDVCDDTCGTHTKTSLSAAASFKCSVETLSPEVASERQNLPGSSTKPWDCVGSSKLILLFGTRLHRKNRRVLEVLIDT